VSREIQLRPPETSIARPTQDELRELIGRLASREATETAPKEYAVAEEGGQATRLVLEGSADGIELIRLLCPEGEAVVTERLGFELARELGWQLHDPAGRRRLGPPDASTLAAYCRHAGVIRSGLMVLCASVVFVGVVLWHAGDRRDDAWLGVVGLAVVVYFALRLWGFMDRLRSRDRRS